ncbi:MAG: type IV pilus secretin PilQ [Desulfobacterales bacterium]|nr:type IV pilus secretin PilQ [Desulfobacterales bacterium]
MFNKISMRKATIISSLIAFSLICLISGCAQAPTKKPVTPVVEERPAEIQSVNVISDPQGKEATIEITSSKLVPYATFKLVQPLRLVVGLNALPVQGPTGPAVINGKIVKDIHFETAKDKPVSTRVIATLSQDVEYNVQEEDRTIRLVLSPKIQVAAKPMKEEEIGPKEPRRFFSPGKTKLNEILGIDFFMLPQGKSRVAVTTGKKATYELSRKNTLTLLLNIKEATIIPELTRYIDSSQFEGVVSRITPIVKVAERRVDLEIALKEMVPYHLMQTDTEIRLDFNKTSVKPPAKKITPARLAKAPVKPEEVPPEVKPAVRPMRPPKPLKKEYTGARMTMDFADADIRNILKLIGEVSKLNIVWGAEVKGTVSMRLKDVPWDQALDVVLETNNLGMIREKNIIWVTTREKIKQLEQEEADKRKAEEERRKEEQAEKQRAKAVEPLFTEYIPVDFANAEADIKPLVENIKSERGSISVDKRTNTIIMTDLASIVKRAKSIVKEFDTPVKQIMIQARIVDASTSLSRDLGVRWNAIDAQERKPSDTPWYEYPSTEIRTSPWLATPLWSRAAPTDPNFPSGAGPERYRYGGTFATAAPTGWTPNIGLSFARVTRGGLAGLALDAHLALAETEGKAKIISAPKVIASNGEKAEITRGDIIYKEIVKADTTDIKELPATLSLTVTPTVSFNNYVTMDVEVKDDKVYEDQTGKTEKRIKTKLMIRSGDTVVIGGIFKEDKSETETGIPWLRKIPILGWLFGAQTKVSARSELLIFLTPSVIERAAKKL